MIVDGKAIAESMFADQAVEIGNLSRHPKLAVVTCAPNFETQSFLRIKSRKAKQIGIDINLIELLANATTDEAVACITKAAESADAILVQMPFPPHIDRESIVQAIPSDKDADAFRLVDEEVLPPVAGAVSVILATHEIDVAQKRVIVIGAGRLVGQPVVRWLKSQGADVRVLTEESVDIAAETTQAEIIVLGAGVAGLLTPDMIQEGAIVIDAGTTEDAGELRGDADPSCAEKTSLFTPVPGGVGPITVAVLMNNVLKLTKRSGNVSN